MSLFALVLLLVAALLHATWNLFLKRVEGGLAFQWLFALLSTAMYLPAVLVFVWFRPPSLSAAAAPAIAVSSVLHTLYYFVLQRGYRAGDLSLVYPLARGTGPFLAVAGAVLLLGEHPPGRVLAGGVLIVLGVFAVGWTTARRPGRQSRAAVAYGLVTGVVIAGYTLWDKYAVSEILLPPLLLDWGTNCGRALLLAPLAWRRGFEVRLAWREHKREALAVALLNPLAYILVLTALEITPVSYIAPAREVSILIGSLLGARLLGERDAKRRLMGAASMVVGIVLLVEGC